MHYEMAGVLMRLYTSRKARMEARRALAKHFRDAWGPDEGGGCTAGAHKFGSCRELTSAYSDELTPACPVCAGSAPLHAAYVAASREAGNALRQAQAIGRRFAQDLQP